MTGQSDMLNSRQVDMEANSGMSSIMSENPLESTGTGLGLHLSASVIHHINGQDSQGKDANKEQVSGTSSPVPPVASIPDWIIFNRRLQQFSIGTGGRGRHG